MSNEFRADSKSNRPSQPKPLKYHNEPQHESATKESGILSNRHLREVVHDLFEGKCTWCKQRVFLSKIKKGAKPKPNDSTIDHVDQHADGTRKDRCRVVCACYRCNQRRAKASTDMHLRGVRIPESVPDGLPRIMVDLANDIVLDEILPTPINFE